MNINRSFHIFYVKYISSKSRGFIEWSQNETKEETQWYLQLQPERDRSNLSKFTNYLTQDGFVTIETSYSGEGKRTRNFRLFNFSSESEGGTIIFFIIFWSFFRKFLSDNVNFQCKLMELHLFNGERTRQASQRQRIRKRVLVPRNKRGKCHEHLSQRDSFS